MPELPKEMQEGFKSGTLPQPIMERLQRNLQSGKLRFDQTTGVLSTGEEIKIPQTDLTDPEATPSQQAREQLTQKREEFTGQAVPLAMEVAGGAVGDVVGSRFGPGGRAIASGVGAAGGRMVGEGLKKVGAIPGQPLSGKEILQEGALAGGAAAAGSGIGNLILKALQKGARPFAGSITKEGIRAQRTLEGLGSFLPPAKVTSSKTLDILDNVTEASLFGGSGLKELEAKNVDLVTSQLDNIVNNFTKQASKEETGELVQVALSDAKEAFQATARTQFTLVDQLTKDVAVNLAPLKGAVTEVIRQAKAGLRSASLDDLLKQLIDKPDKVSFREAQSLRSDLLSLSRTTTDPLSGRMQGLGRKFAKDIDTAMLSGINNADFIDPTTAVQAKEQFRRANKFFAEGKTKFNNTLTKSLINGDPDVVLDKLLKMGRTTRIREVRNEVVKTRGGKAVWGKVQGSFMKKLIGAGDRDEILNGAKVLKKFDNFTPETLREIFPNGEARKFKNFLQTLKTTQENNPSGIGKIFIQLKSAGAVSDIIGGGLILGSSFDTTGAIILGGPAVLNQIFTKPALANFLTRGLKLGEKSRLLTNFNSRLATLLTKEGIDFKRVPAQEISGEDLTRQIKGVQSGTFLPNTR